MFMVVLGMYFYIQPTEFRAEIFYTCTKITSCDVECFKMVCLLSNLKNKYLTT